MKDDTAGTTWYSLLKHLLDTDNFGPSPRGMKTKELIGWQTVIDMNYPIINCPKRKLGYKFMAAEAYWILSGDNSVASIAPYSKHISDFSDDGVRFFGAYGPKIVDQLSYLVQTLVKDPDSRQAVINIWRENPRETKDVPCTLSIQALMRNEVLTLSVTMRSSDAWLGIPYDIFNFSMLGHFICLELRQHMWITPGHLCITAASEHLYERNWDEARLLTLVDIEPAPGIPYNSFESTNDLMVMLATGRIHERGILGALE
jgi:thymidylate synthase